MNYRIACCDISTIFPGRQLSPLNLLNYYLRCVTPLHFHLSTIPYMRAHTHTHDAYLDVQDDLEAELAGLEEELENEALFDETPAKQSGARLQFFKQSSAVE